VTETFADRSVPPSPRGFHFRTAPRTWGRWSVCVVILLVVALVFYILGRSAGLRASDDISRNYAALSARYEQLTNESNAQKNEIETLNARLKGVQVQLDEILRPERTFEINSNESMKISTGPFTIGLIGAPANDKVSINVNGKPQSAAAGGIIDVPLSTVCRVEVKAFDLFKAVIATTCAQAKP
jgi:hypothetical protein